MKDFCRTRYERMHEDWTNDWGLSIDDERVERKVEKKYKYINWFGWFSDGLKSLDRHLYSHAIHFAFDALVHSLSLSFSLSFRLPHRPQPTNARDDRNCLYMRPFTFSIRLLCDAIYLFYYCILNMLRIDKIYVCVWMNGPYLYIYVFDYRPSSIIVVCAFDFTVCCVCVTGWFIHSFWSHLLSSTIFWVALIRFDADRRYL